MCCSSSLTVSFTEPSTRDPTTSSSPGRRMRRLTWSVSLCSSGRPAELESDLESFFGLCQPRSESQGLRIYGGVDMNLTTVTDLWRMSATDLAETIRSKQAS